MGSPTQKIQMPCLVPKLLVYKNREENMFSFDKAFEELSNRTSLDDLIDLVSKTSARVDGAADNVTSLLYSGTIDGQSI